MNEKQQKLREEWFAALESGEFEQGACALCFKDKYCCLGVLVETLNKNGTLEQLGYDFVKQGDSKAIKNISAERLPFSNTLMPPKDVMVSVGLSTDDADILASYNDAGGPFSGVKEFLSKVEKTACS